LYSNDTEYNSFLKHDKQQFYNDTKKYGFDAEDIVEETRLPKMLNDILNGDITAMLKFNAMLMQMHRSKTVNIIDAIINLTTDFIDETELMKYLQPNVIGLLSSELAQKHNMYSINSTSAINKFIR
jgi:hypothetical protein